MWGDRDSSLNEYAYRLWAGLLSTFYKERWIQFFDAVEGGKYEDGAFSENIKTWEEKWTKLTVADVVLESEVSGGGMELAKQAFELVTGKKKVQL